MRHDYPSDPVWSVKDGACGAVFGTRKKPFRRAPIRCAIVLPYHSAYGTAHGSTTACAQRLVPVGYESASSFDHYEKRKNQTNPSPWPTGLIFGFVWFGTAIAAEDEHFCRKGNFILDKCRLNGVQYERPLAAAHSVRHRYPAPTRDQGSRIRVRKGNREQTRL